MSAEPASVGAVARRHGLKALPYLATVLSFGLGLWQKWPCHAAGWPYDPDLIFGMRCHSDLPQLYVDRGLADGLFPYATEQSLEYPVITGYVMDVTARMVSTAPAFFLLNLLVLLGCALVTVWAIVALTGRTAAGLLVAVAPSMALTGTINWDLVAVMFATLALLAWARQRPALAGLAIGLGAAAKLYPALLLFPIMVLTLRSLILAGQRSSARSDGRSATAIMLPAMTAFAVAVAGWVVVNAPVALLFPAGWARFWQFNADRGAEFGSAFYALVLLDSPVEQLNVVAMLLLVACVLAIAWYALAARNAPSMAVLSLLTVTAFLVTNKVYSPQYVLWLLPLAVAAGAHLITLISWQLAEVAYWFAVWGHLAGSVTPQTYAQLTFVRIALQLILCASALANRQLAPVDPVRGDRHPARLEQVESGVAA
jgi:uncharacterized membrane protein